MEEQATSVQNAMQLQLSMELQSQPSHGNTDQRGNQNENRVRPVEVVNNAKPRQNMGTVRDALFQPCLGRKFVMFTTGKNLVGKNKLF